MYHIKIIEDNESQAKKTNSQLWLGQAWARSEVHGHTLNRAVNKRQTGQADQLIRPDPADPDLNYLVVEASNPTTS